MTYAVSTGRAITSFSGSWAFLSNFHPCRVVLDDGFAYPSAEHAFQAQKTGDIRERMTILRAPTAAKAKSAGRLVTLIDDWDACRKRVMLDVLTAKFWQNPELGEQLCQTGDARLMEGNTWHDQFWGNCTCPAPSCALPGRNYLGKLLMAVRMVMTSD